MARNIVVALLLFVAYVCATSTFDYFHGEEIVEEQVFIDYSPFTVTAFVNPKQYSYGIIASKDISTLEPQFRLELHGDGRVAMFFDGIDVNTGPGSKDPNGWTSPLTTAEAIPLNKFTHIAVTRSGVDFSLYVNGKISSKCTGLYHANFSSTTSFRIGSRHAVGTTLPIHLFPGVIRNAAFYNKQLSDAEILRSHSYDGQNVGAVGGALGSAFTDAPLVTQVDIYVYNSTDQEYYGVTALQVYWGTIAGAVHGGYFADFPDYKKFTFVLSKGEFITGAVIQYDEFVQSIQFITNLRKSPVYGKDRGITATLVLPPGAGLTGFSGKSGWAIDSVGLNYAYIQEYYVPPPTPNDHATGKNETAGISILPSHV